MKLRHEHPRSRSACPTDQFEWFVNHTLSAKEQAAVEAHLVTCVSCQAEVRTLIALRQSMREVSMLTPEPRADLFTQIERRLDLIPSPASVPRLPALFQACWFALSVCGEHFYAQARLIRRNLFWMPLFIVPFVCSIVYLPQSWPHAPGEAALLAALITALGMAFLYSQEADPAREMTQATLTSPQMVLGIRCCLVFGYDLLLNCGLVLPLLALHNVITPAWFLANWLAPLCCLSAIALLLSILINASAAVLVCALLWGIRLLGGVQALVYGGQILPAISWQQSYESFWHQGPLQFAIAILAVSLAFIALERKEQFAR